MPAAFPWVASSEACQSYRLTARQVTANALGMLTRLRQLALHPALIPPDYGSQLLEADEEQDRGRPVREITPRGKTRLLVRLMQAIEDNEECPVCMNILDNPRITHCEHSFCLAWCVLQSLEHIYVITELAAYLKYHGSGQPHREVPFGSTDNLFGGAPGAIP